MVPGTPTLDIAHGLQAVIEKGLDDRSQGGIAQQDIQKYYDSVDIFLVIRWLQGRGVPVALCAAVLRHQILPQVVLNIGTCAVDLPRVAGVS